MSARAADGRKFNPVEADWHWASLGRWPGLLFALEMVGIVAVVDYVTGYELRLAILYLLPIALATWTGGARSGVLVSVVGGLCWFVSFRSNNIYSNNVFYYWEGVVLLITFITFVMLLARLHMALARADERFRRVLEGLYAGVYVVDDPSGEVLYSNQRLARMIDGDSLSMRTSDFEGRFSSARFGNEEIHRTQRLAEETMSFTSEEVHDAYADRWYLMQSGPIPWGGKQHVSLKVLTDITEQKQAQMLKRQHREMLHYASRFAALTEVASLLAHELNQPLTAIASYNDACLRLLAQENHEVEALRVALERCRVQAMRAGQIVSRTRDLIRRRDPEPVRGDINEVVREAARAIELELLDGGVVLDLQLAEALPTSLFDRVLIMQVIVNLLHNAVEAMQSVEPSHRRLSVSTRIGDDGDIMVSVVDSGPGVTESIESLLYTPFFSTKPQGLGLGLVICRSAIEAHAGHLWHSVVPAGGMSFHFTLPCEADEREQT